jgi:hypothetical protein
MLGLRGFLGAADAAPAAPEAAATDPDAEAAGAAAPGTATAAAAAGAGFASVARLIDPDSRPAATSNPARRHWEFRMALCSGSYL